jgi:hypothetical protein
VLHARHAKPSGRGRMLATVLRCDARREPRVCVLARQAAHTYFSAICIAAAVIFWL